MKKITIAVIAILGFISVNIFAQQQDSKPVVSGEKTETLYLNKIDDNAVKINFNRLELADKLLNHYSNENNIVKFKQNVSPEVAGKKSIAKGIIFSVLLPGAGEFYAKSYLKSAIFLALEAASWIYYASYQSKGNTQTDKFQSYADKYWDVREYARWLKAGPKFTNTSSINPDEPNLEVLRQEINACESVNFSHTLPSYKTQQYYELIGKYQNFQGGWTNLNPDFYSNSYSETSPFYWEYYRDPVFVNYSYDRQKANDYFNYSKTGIYAAILNHFLSAADAAWSVSIYNRNLKVQTGFNIQRYRSPETGEYGNLPCFNLRVNF